jgi:hypothetical protein
MYGVLTHSLIYVGGRRGLELPSPTVAGTRLMYFRKLYKTFKVQGTSQDVFLNYVTWANFVKFCFGYYGVGKFPSNKFNLLCKFTFGCFRRKIRILLIVTCCGEERKKFCKVFSFLDAPSKKKNFF